MSGEKRESGGEGGLQQTRKQLSHAEELSLSAGAQSTDSSVSRFDIDSTPGKALEGDGDTHPASGCSHG